VCAEDKVLRDLAGDALHGKKEDARRILAMQIEQGENASG
jgi:hypothetical protein